MNNNVFQDAADKLVRENGSLEAYRLAMKARDDAPKGSHIRAYHQAVLKAVEQHEGVNDR